eukprot:16434099-Heterocapsa_arctica.AAC.1
MYRNHSECKLSLQDSTYFFGWDNELEVAWRCPHGKKEAKQVAVAIFEMAGSKDRTKNENPKP